VGRGTLCVHRCPSSPPPPSRTGEWAPTPLHSDGCRAAVDAALAALRATTTPLEAAVAGVVVLEDDPRFNAGTGSIVRLDGSVQMDASVMDSGGGSARWPASSG
jgi:isoaspartyl peptidase/L-asparaginase-like protein (Ntn-hydrolase superfamily)